MSDERTSFIRVFRLGSGRDRPRHSLSIGHAMNSPTNPDAMEGLVPELRAEASDRARVQNYVNSGHGPVVMAEQQIAWKAADTIERLERTNADNAKRIADLEAMLERVRVAADDLLAPVCAEAGRLLVDHPECNLTPYLPPLKAKLFAALYDATGDEALKGSSNHAP